MRAKGAAQPQALTPELRQVLLRGPWSVGLTLRTMRGHDALLELWQVHERELRAACPRGRSPWFASRLDFVQRLRGEIPPR
jgi:hypothetical protein